MKRSYQKEVFELQERSDIDPHEKFDPEELGWEDWGEGFYVNPTPVLVERGERGEIVRTTPLSELTPEQRLGLLPKRKSEVQEAAPVATPRPISASARDKMVDILAARLLHWYSQYPPNALPYNPLYDGIPVEDALGSDLHYALEPNKIGANLVHVTAAEVHEFLRKVIGKRMEIYNEKTGKKGWNGDLADLRLRLKR